MSASVIELPPKKGNQELLVGRDFVQMAKDLRPYLLEHQADVERRARYSRETFEWLRETGFFRILQPKRFGGYEIDLRSYVEIVMELARGCPSTGWCVTLAAGHPPLVGSHYPLDVQAEFFGPDNHFVAPLAGGSRGVTTKRVEGGWIVNGTWLFCSGVPYGTHFQGFLAIPTNELIAGTPADDVTPCPALMTIKDGWEMLEDWGDLIGLKGSGSNSVKVTDAFVPDRYIVPFAMFPDNTTDVIGYEIHKNALFAVPFYSLSCLELHALAVGIVSGMFDEFRQIVQTRKMPLQGDEAEFWYQNSVVQQAFGYACARVDAARAIIVETAETIEVRTRAAVEDNVPFEHEDMMRLYGQGAMACELAWEAAGIMLKHGSSSAARDGQRLQRYWRDICAFRSNGTQQFDRGAISLARAAYGMSPDFFLRASVSIDRFKRQATASPSSASPIVP